MDREQTIERIKKKYNVTIDENTKYPIPLPMGMHQCLPALFKELGFTKGAEVGIYRAVYSKELLDQIPNLHLIGVDLWAIYPGYKDFSESDITDAERQSRETYAKYGESGHFLIDLIPAQSSDDLKANCIG